MTTKKKIIQMALTELGIGEQFAQLTPEDIQEASKRLDMFLFSQLNGLVGWHITDNVDQDIALPLPVERYAVLGLAKEIAPSYGIAFGVERFANFQDAKTAFYKWQLPPAHMPTNLAWSVGSGNRRSGLWWGWRSENANI